MGPTKRSTPTTSVQLVTGIQQDVSAKIPSITDMSAGYHIFGVQLIPGTPSINWYFDGTQMSSYSGSVTPQGYEIMLQLEIAAQRSRAATRSPFQALPHLHAWTSPRFRRTL